MNRPARSRKQTVGNGKVQRTILTEMIFCALSKISAFCPQQSLRSQSRSISTLLISPTTSISKAVVHPSISGKGKPPSPPNFVPRTSHEHTYIWRGFLCKMRAQVQTDFFVVSIQGIKNFLAPRSNLTQQIVVSKQCHDLICFPSTSPISC